MASSISTRPSSSTNGPRFFLNLDNLLKRTYYTCGTFTQLDAAPPSLGLTNPETLSPSPRRVVYAGLRATF
jgi:hypothetical protein